MNACTWTRVIENVGKGFRHGVSDVAGRTQRRCMTVARVLADGSVSVQDDGDNPRVPPGPGIVNVKLRAAPCTLTDLRILDASGRSGSLSLKSNDSFPLPGPVGGTEGVFEVTEVGEGVVSLKPGDLAVPIIPQIGVTADLGTDAGTDSDYNASHVGTWRSVASLSETSLVKLPPQGVKDLSVAAHVSFSVATALRVLADFSPSKQLGEGDRIVFTGASSAVAQVLLQLAAARGMESVCLVSNKEEAALADRLGAWKAAELKEFKAMRMSNAYLVADGEGGVLGFTAARGLRFRGHYVSYADASGDGVSLPVAGQIFSDTRCRGFSLPRWRREHSEEEARALVSQALESASSLRMEEVREFPFSEASAAVDAARTPGGPVLLRG